MTGQYHSRGTKSYSERDSELTVNLPPSTTSDSTYALLLHMVTKLTDLLENKNVVQDEIRQLRGVQNAYEEKQQRL